MKLLKSIGFGIGLLAAIAVFMAILKFYVVYATENDLTWEMLYIPMSICTAAWFTYLHYKYSK